MKAFSIDGDRRRTMATGAGMPSRSAARLGNLSGLTSKDGGANETRNSVHRSDAGQRPARDSRALARVRIGKLPFRKGPGLRARKCGNVSLWVRSTPGQSGNFRRPCRPTRDRCDVPSAATSYVKSSRWPTRRSTNWNGGVNFPSVSSSQRAVSYGTWPRSRHGCRAGGSQERMTW